MLQAFIAAHRIAGDKDVAMPMQFRTLTRGAQVLGQSAMIDIVGRKVRSTLR
jgi:hypothetical protein